MLRGPVQGIVSAQRTFDDGIFYAPLITCQNEIIVALKNSIIIMDKKLNIIWEQHLSLPRTLTLTSDNRLIVGCNDGLVIIDRDRKINTFALSDEFRQGTMTPFTYMVEGPGRKFYTLTGDAVFCLKEDLSVLWTESMAKLFGLIGGWRMAVHSGGMVFVSGAFSWCDNEGFTDYAGYLCAIADNGEVLWQKNHEIDELPTNTGLSLRLITTSRGIWLSDSGAVHFDLEGHEIWRSPNEEGTTQLFAVMEHDKIIFSQDKELLFLSDSKTFHPEKLLSPRGWPHEICSDGNKCLYILGTEGLEAWDSKGLSLFQLNGLIGERVAMGEEFLVVASKRGKISVIE